MKRPILAGPARAALLALPLLASGCFGLGAESIDPVYEIDEEKYVVVHPFKDLDLPTAWDSPLGHELALRTTEVLNREADFYVCPYGDVLELLIAPPSKTANPKGDEAIGLDVRTLTPKKLGELMGADFVLMAKLTQFDLRDPLNINMVQGTAKAEVTLFKLAKTDEEEEDAEEASERMKRMNEARKALGLDAAGEPLAGGWFVGPTSTVEANYPDDFLNQYGDVFLDEQVIRDGLIRVLARKVAQLYYEHDKERLSGSGN